MAMSSCSAQERKLLVFRRQARIEVGLSLKSDPLHNVEWLWAFRGLICVNLWTNMQGSGPAMAGFALTPEEGLFAMRSALGRLRFIATTAPKQFVLGIAQETRTTHRKSMAYSAARERFFGSPDRSFSIRLLLKRYATFGFA